jgi:hypothetical protein
MLVPNHAKPVVTPPVGVSAEEANPTWLNDPEVGMIYISSVELNLTDVELDVMVQGTVVSELSAVIVTLTEVPVQLEGTDSPTYARPGIVVSFKGQIKGKEGEVPSW